jgi:hypothetical protein
MVGDTDMNLLRIGLCSHAASESNSNPRESIYKCIFNGCICNINSLNR